MTMVTDRLVNDRRWTGTGPCRDAFAAGMAGRVLHPGYDDPDRRHGSVTGVGAVRWLGSRR